MVPLLYIFLKKQNHYFDLCTGMTDQYADVVQSP